MSSFHQTKEVGLGKIKLNKLKIKQNRNKIQAKIHF